MHVTDLEGNEYPLQATMTNEYELNGNQSLSFKILPTKVNDQFINDITEMWSVIDHDDVEHKIVYLKKQGFGDSLTVNVKAVPKFFDELDTKRIYEEHNGSMTAQACFNLIFNDTNFNVVLVDSFYAVEWEGLGAGESKLESFKRALNRYKAEFRISGNTVYIEKQIGRDTQFMYRYRLNASNIVQENDASNYWTFARGYGDFDGVDGWQSANLIREHTSPIAGIIGIREAPPIKNGNITQTSTMDEQLKELVDESLKISVSATIHDLRKQGYDLAQPEKGDRVFLIDERIGLNVEARIVDLKIVRDSRGKVLDIDIVFGTMNIVKRHQSNLQTAIDSISDLIEGKERLPYNALDDAVRKATEALQSAETELIFENGIIAQEKDNPNEMVIYNSKGLGISNDGGGTFDTAITGKGIVADVITSGTLRSIIVDSVSIYGSEFISEVGDEHTIIRGAHVNARGNHTRTWRGRTATHDVSLRLEHGYFRARNENKNWSLYFSDWGISTYRDGTGDDDASGFIEFHSPDYSPTGSESGLTMGSLAGRVGIETDGSRIYLNPNGSDVYVADMQERFYNLRAGQIYTTAIRQHPDGQAPGLHLYLGVSGTLGAEVRVTNLELGLGDPVGYRDIRARDFITDTSIRKNKKDVEMYERDVLSVIRKSNAYLYHRLDDENNTKKQLGLMIDELPEVTHSRAGDSFGLYSLIGFLFRGQKQLLEEIDKLKEVS